jgi:dTDP-4-amino-4,6-dideoxygalactose transaminase
MIRPRIPYSKPSIDESDVEAVVSALRSGWLAFGEEKEKFEAAFAIRIGVPYAASTNSCTSALEIALLAAGIRGEVVVPSFTWVATVNAIVNAGASPVFCDVELETGNMTAETIGPAISPRSEAVIVVHYAGQPCAMNAIVDLCQRRRLLLIEDSAETLGAEWNSKAAGSFGIGCFSFYPTKAMTTGEGGMLTTRDRALAEKARTLISHGVPTSPPLDGRVHVPWERAAVAPGRNYRMPNLLAALGLNQLRRLDVLNARRIALAQRYDHALASAALRIHTPIIQPGASHVYQMYVVRAGAMRNGLLRRLWDDGIGANVHFDPPVHRQPLYLEKTERTHELPNTERLSSEVLSLPIYPSLTNEEQDCVIARVCAASESCASGGEEGRK